MYRIFREASDEFLESKGSFIFLSTYKVWQKLHPKASRRFKRRGRGRGCSLISLVAPDPVNVDKTYVPSEGILAFRFHQIRLMLVIVRLRSRGGLGSLCSEGKSRCPFWNVNGERERI